MIDRIDRRVVRNILPSASIKDFEKTPFNRLETVKVGGATLGYATFGEETSFQN